jgi:hypothetical protein
MGEAAWVRPVEGAAYIRLRSAALAFFEDEDEEECNFYFTVISG